jgi:formylglycine-generating enzyme required for sulfatase activity
MRGGSSKPYVAPHPDRGLRGTLLAALVSVVVPLAATDTARGALGGGKLQLDRIKIPAGPFKRGSTRALDERPVETKRLKRFEIDRTEVTRAMYARCVAARRCKKLPIDLAVDADLPVTHVSWHDARAFCAYAGGRLPTEDEWEKAARGEDGREFPWGAEADCSRGNWGNFDGEGPCAGKNPGKPVAVGRYPTGASPFGVLDLGGNVWEWVDSPYADEPGRRVVRGGSCCSYFVEPRAANRNAWAPDHRDGDLGFRCASR